MEGALTGCPVHLTMWLGELVEGAHEVSCPPSVLVVYEGDEDPDLYFKQVT